MAFGLDYYACDFPIHEKPMTITIAMKTTSTSNKNKVNSLILIHNICQSSTPQKSSFIKFIPHTSACQKTNTEIIQKNTKGFHGTFG